MPDSLVKPTGGLTTSAPAQVGSGTYQVGTAPMSLKQKAKQAQQVQAAHSAGAAKQKIKSFAPDPRIKGRTSFSDEMGD